MLAQVHVLATVVDDGWRCCTCLFVFFVVDDFHSPNLRVVVAKHMVTQLACANTKLDVVQHEHCARGPFVHDGMGVSVGLRAMAA